jgi:SAM-dependent methyltransferase
MRQEWEVNGPAWDRVAEWLTQMEPAPRTPRECFNWTQFRGEGPGHELFGDVDDRAVLEVGCGGGDALAFLVERGAVGTGVDAAPGQVRRAASRWENQFPAGRIRFLSGDAAITVGTLPAGSFDVGYSVFGAIGHSDPRLLLPSLHRALRSGGRLLFAVRHPDWPHPVEEVLEEAGPPICRRVVRLQLPSGASVTIVRYAFSIEGWLGICRDAGYHVDDVLEVSARPSRLTGWDGGPKLDAVAEAAGLHPCSLIITASKA